MSAEVFTHQSLSESLQTIMSAKRWWVGFSGGLDSTVLLWALVQWRRQASAPTPELLAIHVNHGLSLQASRWQQHCDDLCRQWDVQFITETVVITSAGKGVEAAARSARYEAFARHLKVGDVLLTGHHQDDQAETLLLRLLRGSGVRGLTAMAAQRSLGPARIQRPLLEFSRQQLQTYAKLQDLKFVHDDSNSQEQYDRNFLRHRILPELQQRWPKLASRWARTARVLGESEQALGELAAMDLGACEEQPARYGWAINIELFRGLSVARRHNLIRYWCQQRRLALPEYKHLLDLDAAMAAGADRLCVQWRGVSLRTYGDKLYLLPAFPVAAESFVNKSVKLDSAESGMTLPDHSQLTLRLGRGGLRSDLGPFSLRWRRGGERCRPQQRQHSQTLKKCLQEFRLEPWLRERVPLVYCGETLVAVGDLWICHGYGAPKDGAGLMLRWTYPPAFHEAK
jgi:tRNA(Ile)-lysidine synthase